MTQSHYHAVVWLDHREARVFHFSPTEVDKMVIHPDHPTRHLHHKANAVGSGHAAPNHEYLHAVTAAFADAGAVLVAGPGSAKTELVSHVEKHDPKLRKLIVAVETVDHPSDGQLVAHARKYFKVEDRMLPQRN